MHPTVGGSNCKQSFTQTLGLQYLKYKKTKFSIKLSNVLMKLKKKCYYEKNINYTDTMIFPNLYLIIEYSVCIGIISHTTAQLNIFLSPCWLVTFQSKQRNVSVNIWRNILLNRGPDS